MEKVKSTNSDINQGRGSLSRQTLHCSCLSLSHTWLQIYAWGIWRKQQTCVQATGMSRFIWKVRNTNLD